MRLAAPNKYLALNNKSRTRAEATKKQIANERTSAGLRLRRSAARKRVLRQRPSVHFRTICLGEQR